MKKNKYIIIALAFFTTLFFNGCQENDYEFGKIVTPTNIQITAEIVGQDATNPNGDGSGKVNFTVTADNALSYSINFGNTKNESTSNGLFSTIYTVTGTHKYTVIVSANGTGGVKSTKAIEVEVFSSFSDVEAENLLSGSSVGDSKKWYWAANESGFVSLGPVTDDYGNGEFAYGAWWPGPDAWADDRKCFFDSNEFVFTRTADGVTFEQTVGPAYVPGAYADVIGVAGDQCHDDTVATDMFGVKNVSFGPSTSKAALEGSFNGNPYRGTNFEISDGGFLGWFVGASSYDIISLTADKMIVRIIQAGNGFAWYHTLVSTKPVQGSSYTYNNLVWEDDFNTDGAPDAAKWTYDTGAGGWGNGEAQHYTDRSDNVKVEGGNLVITAKKESFSGSDYTSARLKTQGLFNFKYGRVEVRAKLPGDAGTWPAIWMLGSNFPTVGWPHCGEIDIMEQTGADKNTTLGTLHWFDNTTNANASHGESTAVANASTEFHLYTMEWTEQTVTIYLDDVKFYELANNADLPFNADFFLILNVAMGGTLGGSIDAGFTETKMEVDYVKVYQ